MNTTKLSALDRRQKSDKVPSPPSKKPIFHETIGPSEFFELDKQHRFFPFQLAVDLSNMWTITLWRKKVLRYCPSSSCNRHFGLYSNKMRSSIVIFSVDSGEECMSPIGLPKVKNVVSAIAVCIS